MQYSCYANTICLSTPQPWIFHASKDLDRLNVSFCLAMAKKKSLYSLYLDLMYPTVVQRFNYSERNRNRCLFCKEFDLSNVDPNQSMAHQPSFAALQNSAIAGCDLCRLFIIGFKDLFTQKEIENLLKGRNEYDIDTSVHLERSYVDIRRPSAGMRDHIRVIIGNLVNEQGERLVSRYICLPIYAEKGMLYYSSKKNTNLQENTGSTAAKSITYRPVSLNPGSEESIALINSWLEICKSHHMECRKPEQPLPTRVIDVLDNQKILSTHGESGSYIALSYCWGKSGKNILLSRDNLRDFQTRGVNINILPKTVRDAIQITKRIGVRYLWVDALCIIQQEQDLKDFKIEALKMAEYYRNAYVTISVALAADCSKGFLGDRQSSKVAPCEVKYTPKIHYSIRTGPVSGAYIHLLKHGDLHEDNLKPEPIDTRAWALQESELSPRILSFKAEHFSFQCDGQLFSEYYQTSSWQRRKKRGDVGALSDKGFYAHGLSGAQKVLENNYKLGMEHIWTWWYQTVGKYSQREMTNPKDKFAAIAGIVMTVQELAKGKNMFMYGSGAKDLIVQTKYIFGLWSHDLPRGLFWTTGNFLLNKTRPRQLKRQLHIAPSWSWASIDGYVQYLDWPLHENWWVKIGYERVSESLDPIRAVLGPNARELWIRGILKEAKIVTRPVGYESAGHVRRDFVVDKDLEDECLTIVQLASQQLGASYFDIQGEWTRREIGVLRLTEISALLLGQIDERKYQRLGIMVSFDITWFDSEEDRDIVLV